MEKIDLFRMSEFGLISELKKSMNEKNLNSRGPYGRTALICACMCNQVQIVDFLLKNGADHKITCNYGWTALDWATKLGQKQCVKILLSLATIVRKDTKDIEPKTIFAAIQTGDDYQMEKFIAQKKQCLADRTVCRRTALHVAALVGSLRCWEILIKLGMSDKDRDEFGLTPINYVQMNQFNHLLQILPLEIKSFRQIIQNKFDNEQTDFDVIIVGAGAAGIGAAKHIQEKTNKSYVILEARNRVGGRVYGEKVGAVQQDFGASWIHNYDKDNPFRKHVEKLKWPLEKNVMKPLEWFDVDTLKYDSDLHFQAEMIYNQITQNGKMEARRHKKQCSIWDSIKKQYEKLVEKGSHLERYMNYCKFFTEHYEAASISEIDVFYDNYSFGNAGDATPLPSYFKFIEAVSQGLNIRLSSVVTRIDYSNKPTLTLYNNNKLTADKIIVTLPLGVLKAKKVEFFPQLPAAHLSAIDKLGFGLMNKVFLHYDQKFWKGQMRIISAQNGKMPWFFDRSQGDNYVLMVFLTADYARSLTHLDQQKILTEAHNVLLRIYGEKCGKLLGGKVTKWQLDQFALGSYSFFKVGSDDEDCSILSEPVNNKLFFAGQHLYSKNIGTAYGAYLTGQSAAEKASSK